MDKKKFGRQLFSARKAKNMTSNQLAEKMKVSGSYIRQMECGTRLPSIRVLIEICNILDTSVDFLLEGDLKNHSADQVAALTDRLRLLPQPQLRIVDQFISAVEDSQPGMFSVKEK